MIAHASCNQTGWCYAYTVNGRTTYIKPLDTTGRERQYLSRNNKSQDLSLYIMDCSAWRETFAGIIGGAVFQPKWEDILPGSYGEIIAKMICGTWR